MAGSQRISFIPEFLYGYRKLKDADPCHRLAQKYDGMRARTLPTLSPLQGLNDQPVTDPKNNLENELNDEWRNDSVLEVQKKLDQCFQN